MSLVWTDSHAIAMDLADKFPQVDPSSIRFTDLHTWVCELENFDDDPKHSGERILEAIQACWIEEAH